MELKLNNDLFIQVERISEWEGKININVFIPLSKVENFTNELNALLDNYRI